MAGTESLPFDLNKSWANLCLEEEEEGGESEEVIITATINEDPIDDNKWTLAGRFLTDQPVKFEYTKQALASIWRPFQKVAIERLQSNLFTFKFYCDFDLERVIEGSPWKYDHN